VSGDVDWGAVGHEAVAATAGCDACGESSGVFEFDLGLVAAVDEKSCGFEGGLGGAD
jgi:hypothetical protein